MTFIHPRKEVMRFFFENPDRTLFSGLDDLGKRGVDTTSETFRRTIQDLIKEGFLKLHFDLNVILDYEYFTYGLSIQDDDLEEVAERIERLRVYLYEER